MKKSLLLIGIIFLTSLSVFAKAPRNENIFNRLTKDEVNGKAVLVFSVKIENSIYKMSGGNITFSKNAIVYNCQMTWFDAKRDKETKLYNGNITYYYTVDPGEIDINLIDVVTENGPYTRFVEFPLSGKFTLEAGTINYLGEIEVDLSKDSYSIFQGENAYKILSENFKKDYPVIYNSANGKIDFIHFTPSVPYESAESIFNDDFSQSNTDWQFTTDNYHKITTLEGKMLIDNQGTDSCVVSKKVEFPESFDVQAECTWVSGENNKGFGLIVGNDLASCLKFTVTASGYYCIYRWLPKTDLKWIPEKVINWTKSDVINTKPGEKNVIQVQKTYWYQRKIGMIAFYINGKLAARNNYYIYPPVYGGLQFKKEGIVGFYSYGKQAITLDSFKMSTIGK